MVNQTDSLDSSWVNLGTEENQEIAKDRRYSKDEDSYDIISKNLTFAEIINILNQAVREDNCEELDKVVQNIEDYEGRSITLDNENLKDFCSNQLNLELQNRSNHQHIYSNVLSQYKFDQEGFKYDYSVKELVLLAIAANDKLTERCQDILFAEGNLSLLPLLVGGQKYIEAFTEKFHSNDGVHGRLKDQAIQLVEPNKISFFSVIALRKEQELLNAIFVEYVLRDFGQVLKTSKPDPLYGVLETASLIKNEEFITIVLGAFERYINEPTKKASTEELLKKSFATLLETAISQEHISVIEYLCKRYTNSKGYAIYDVYEQAFADDKVITILRQQILKNIGERGRREIYNLVLKTALDAGNIDFITKVLDLIKESPNFSSDTDLLQSSLVTILDHATREQHFSVIQNVYTNFISKLAKNSEGGFLTIQQRYQKACYTSIGINNSVASQLNGKEPNRDDSNLEQNEFEILDIQEERRPRALGSNKSEIAGFSREKLLEIINFVKIGYYVCDLNYNNGKFSGLESRGYKVPGQLRKEGYKVVQFYNMNDGKQYRHAGYVFIKDKEITITYRGSRNGFDCRKDAEIILTSSDGLLPKCGKIHSGFYSLFKDSWSSVYEILKGHANDQQLEIKDFKINLTGHSMGGAIANIAALCLSVTEGAEDLHVATFASPRVFNSSAAEIYKECLGKKTIRVVNQSDFIPSLPFGSMGYKHVGEQLVITSHYSLQRVHLLDTYRNLIANIEPDQFKSDNSVSIYYYPSSLAKVLYNVFTAPSYLILNIHSNDDEQYFKQVKNKHKGASLSEMMRNYKPNNHQKYIMENHGSDEEEWVKIIPDDKSGSLDSKVPSIVKEGQSSEYGAQQITTGENGSNISDKLVISATKSNILSEDLKPESAGSQQTEKNVLSSTKKSNAINNAGASMEETVSNDHKKGKMHANTQQGTSSLEQNKKVSEAAKLAGGNSQLKESLNSTQHQLIEELQEQLASKDKGIDAANQALNAKTKEFESAKAQLERELGSVQQELDKTTEELRRKKADLENSKKELGNVNEKVLKLEHETLNQQASINDLTKERDQLASRTNTLTEKLKNESKKLNDANQALDTKISEVTQLTKQNSQLEEQLRKELNNVAEKLTQEQQKAFELGNQVTTLTKELKEKKAELERENSSLVSQVGELKGEFEGIKTKLAGKEEELRSKIKEVAELSVTVGKLERQTEELMATQAEFETEKAKLKSELTKQDEVLESTQAQLKQEVSSLKGQVTQLAKEKDQLAKQLNDTQQNPNPDNENKKLLAVSAQSRKQITYASVSFVLSGAFAVGASLTMFHLTICISLAVAALTFLAVGCYCSYKANTALSNVEIDNCVNPAVVEV